jgi:LPXTG-motif cell wall-anchored protein
MQALRNLERMSNLGGWTKAAIVIVGYLAAFILASVAVALHTLLADSLGTQAASDGMSAFGDAVLFLLVFGLGALLTTGAALVFLRRKRR